MGPGAMEQHRCLRRDRIRVLWMLIFLAQRVSAQSGFISIACGAEPASSYVDPITSIIWYGDGAYLSTGVSASVDAVSVSRLSVPQQTLRYFPAESSPTKNCYVMPAETSQVYFLRASFFYGNYDSQQAVLPITFQLALDSTVWTDVSVDPKSTEPLVLEAIRVPVTGDELSVCLIRTDDTVAPFINTLEVRPVDGYTQPGDTGGNLHLLTRANFGESVKTYRFPQDPVDRIWPPYTEVYPSLVGQVTDIATSQPILDSGSDRDKVPQVVLQTAITAPSFLNFTNFKILSGSPTELVYISMLFAEYNTTLAPAERLKVDVSFSFLQLPDGEFAGRLPFDITPGAVPPLTAYQLRFVNVSTETSHNTDFSWYLFKNPNSTLNPVISAVELYSTQAVAAPTNSVDGRILSTLRKSLLISTWGGDPCFPVSWNEIICGTGGRVTSLNLSGKNLTGQIPVGIGGLSALNSLNLSNNSFTGVIPSDLGQLASLSVLDLSNNQLTGAVPSWLTILALTELDISNNNLSGTFPDSLLRLGSGFRYGGNPQLLCSGPSCPPSPPSATPVPPTSPPPTSSNDSNSSTSIGPIVGGVVGGIVFILFVGLVLYFCLHNGPKAEKPPPPQESGEPLPLTRRGQAKPFTLRAIDIATSNYSRKIGEGGFGSVYYGVLADEREVAVKKLSPASKQGFQEFVTEMDLLSTIHHRNLVSLVGYCHESSQPVLLYEYMAGGDLHHRLHGPTAEDNPLSWIQRLQIAVDAAKGLEYLHHGCTPKIIHRDVKSTNILMTSKLEAKVSDFGLSKLSPEGKTHVTTLVKGSKGYVDPEYYQTGMLTDKSDVYSFGVLLLEILCGQPPFESRVPSNQNRLAERVESAMMNGGNIDRVVDPRLAGRYQSESAWKFAETAMRCVRERTSERPNFNQVVADLTQAMDIQNPQSEEHSVGASGSIYPGGRSWPGPINGFPTGFFGTQTFHGGEQLPP